MNQDEVEVLHVLREFFAAMRAWETKRNRMDRDYLDKGLLDPETEKKRANVELLQIFDKYCIRFGAPYRSGTYAEPSEFDPEGEKILRIEMGGMAAVVYTHQTTSPPFRKLVYLLREIDGQWRILDFRMLVLEDGGLMPWYL